MQKKLLLMMLVPILALSLVVTSCGGDDEVGVFDGSATYHLIQGVWYSANEVNPDAWFVLTGNQATVSDPIGATGVATRTEFIFGLPFESRFVSQRAFLNDVLAEMVPLANALPAPPAGSTAASPGAGNVARALLGAPGNPTAFSFVVPVADQDPEEPNLIQLAGAFDVNNTEWSDILLLRTNSMIRQVVETAFRNALGNMGVGTDLAFADANLVDELVLGGDPTMREIFVSGVLGDLGLTDGYRLFGFGGTNLPMRFVPFRMEFRTFRHADLAGYVEGFWADFDGAAEGQRFIVLRQEVAQVVENLFIPHIGVYGRLMPTDVEEEQLPAIRPVIVGSTFNVTTAGGGPAANEFTVVIGTTALTDQEIEFFVGAASPTPVSPAWGGTPVVAGAGNDFTTDSSTRLFTVTSTVGDPITDDNYYIYVRLAPSVTHMGTPWMRVADSVAGDFN